jgi:N-acetyl-alpha-D-muramate 1-phosphate uridylyltransferase
MILAAGFGKRMLPLTATTPKPLLKINGKPLIDYHIERLRDAGISEFVINHAHLGEQIENYCGDGSRYGVSIEYSRESEPLETAGGIAKALPLLGDEPFISVNGDIWTNYPFQPLLQHALKNTLAHLVLVDNPEFKTQGDFVLQPDHFLSVAGEPSYTYSGIAVLSQALFDRYQVYEGPLAPLLRLAMADKQISGEHFSGDSCHWYDVGTPQRLAEVSEIVAGIVVKT